ncbi:MAG TPA: bacteriohopanetetrol glucosamine biosynthesis glycosyltransferase HpnI [Janthinobacterium sp.]|jgi:ceramide glucosyltransferase|nr:bacteriohopanetetrol glucosamine biosynthesis glycosyltransferase HpnI [Janthinobacterium sp.]
MASAEWTTLLGYALCGASALYAAPAAWLARRPLRPDQTQAAAAAAARPVSVLKPLRGAEPRLYDNLATFCRQTHPAYQIVFGLRTADDPALAVVSRLRAAFPACDIALVVAPEVHGPNLKISNLINMLPQARHDWLVLADSDIAVAPDYLARVTAPLADPGTGVVTCLYRGRALAGWWSRLGAQFIDEWFAPSVRIAHAAGSRRFAFGATIALRRDTLDAIGGFAALSGRLADDFWLGELSRRRGLATLLSDVVVSTDVAESSLGALWAHEARWLRTIRSLNPAGFSFLFITFTWPVALLGLLLAPRPAVFAAALAGLLARSALAGSAAAALRAPLRDLLLLAVWAAALFGSRVSWRGQILSLKDSFPDAAMPARTAAGTAATTTPRPSSGGDMTPQRTL